MAKINIRLPEKFSFSVPMTVRIRDVNYGGHLDNAALLSLLHEARLSYLKSLGCTELDACGTGLIMTEAAVLYKGEAFHGDRLTVQMAADDITSRGFTFFYRVSRRDGGRETLIAAAQTGMLCFNYETRKVSHVPGTLKEKLAVGPED